MTCNNTITTIDSNHAYNQYNNESCIQLIVIMHTINGSNAITIHGSSMTINGT